MSVDVVCVGAHPDDVEIGMGGIVAGMVRQGMAVALIDLTDGEPTPAGDHDTRMREAAAAAAVLGVATRRTLSQPNRYLMDTVDARTELAEALRELQPRIVFAPFPVDAHPDHLAASAIAEAARFYAKFSKTTMAGEPHYPARLFHYAAVHMRPIESPAVVVDITADLDRKLRALRAYHSQFSANEHNRGVIGSVEEIARTWGAHIGTDAGEPLFSRVPVGVSSIGGLL